MKRFPLTMIVKPSDYVVVPVVLVVLFSSCREDRFAILVSTLKKATVETLFTPHKLTFPHLFSPLEH
jgi:hypothetical protein